MKTTKRIITAIMAVITVLSTFIFSSAVSAKCEDYDLQALRDEFTVTTFNNENYAYYSPVKDENDTAKYPVFVFLHGFGHETSYLSKSWIPYFASEGLQQKFNNGGAHIILPQIWHFAVDAGQINNLVEDYISKNEGSVDRSNIILLGGSLGARKAYQAAVAKPGYYSHVVLACPAVWFHKAELEKIADTPVWLISSKRDILTGAHKSSWNILLSATNVPEQCRWTYFDGDVHSPDGKWVFSHFLAKTLCCDGYMRNGAGYHDTYDYVTVVDGLGNEATCSYIDWAK